MRLMEEVFFSFTFGGEALSLAASLATMRKLRREPVVETMASTGRKLAAAVRELIQAHGLSDLMSVAGHPTWSFLVIKDSAQYQSWAIKSLFLQEMFSRGILMLSTHNISYAHREEDVRKLLNAYDQVLPILADAVHNGRLHSLLRCEPLKPLFKVR